MQDKLKTLEEAATQVKSGTRLVMSANMQRSPMAFLREVVRQRADSLRVIGVVGGEINIDFLVGAGAVGVVDTCSVTLGEYSCGEDCAGDDREQERPNKRSPKQVQMQTQEVNLIGQICKGIAPKH